MPQSQETFQCDGWLFCIKRVVGMAAVLWMSAELAYWFEPTVSGNWVVIRIPFPLSSSFGKEKSLAKIIPTCNTVGILLLGCKDVKSWICLHRA